MKLVATVRRAWMALALGFLAAIAACPAMAVDESERTTRPLDGYYRESWAQRDGLPHSLVNAIGQTPDGYLWLATWEGAARYNGREFVVFDRERVEEMADHGFRAMALGRDGTLWLGASRGGVMQLQDGVWSRLDHTQGLVQDEIMALAEASDGALWIGYESAGVGVRRADGGMQQWTTAEGLPSDVVYGLTLDESGRAWVATAEGLAVIHEGKVQVIALDPEQPRMAVFAVYAKPGWPVLVGSDGGAFEVQDGAVHRLQADLPEVQIQRVFRDRAGDIWIGTINFGVFRISSLGLERIGTESGLPNNRVASIFEDREGSIWIGTNAGLFRLRDAPFASLTVEQGLADNYVRTLIEHSDGSLWVGGSAGLTRVAGRVQQVAVEDGLPQTSVLSLEESSDGSVWVGTYANGVWRVRGNRLVERLTAADGLASNQVRALHEDADGTLWIGTNRGLSRLREGKLVRFSVRDGLPRDFIIALHRDRAGVLWVGTANGLAHLNGEGRFQGIDIDSTANAQDVFGFAEDAGGALWLATDRGLARWHHGKLGRIGLEQGLPIDTVFQVIIDQVGNIWLTSNRGAMRLGLADAESVLDGRTSRVEVELFNELDGMASAQCNGGSGPAAVLRRDGTVAVATSRGVSSVQPQRLREFARQLPPVVIEEFLAEDQSYRLSEMAVLPAGTRRIEFFFAGLSYLMPQKIVYRYRLDGFDDRWVERGNTRHAQFTNLPPGDYTFRVTAANRGGAWNPVEASVRFRIPPLIWQRTEFWVLVLTTLALLAAAVVRWRFVQLGRAKQLLQTQVAERTADLQAKTARLEEADRDKSELLLKLKAQSEAFERQAREDALTGLFNRRAFDEMMAREFARARRSGTQLSLILLDIDWFKRINDTYSHAAGDEALRRVAAALRDCCREVDLCSRYGGEEFAVLCPDTGQADAEALAERLRAAVAAMDCSSFAPGLQITISLGVAEATGLSHHERLVSRSDAALYRAKETGRNRVCT